MTNFEIAEYIKENGIGEGLLGGISVEEVKDSALQKLWLAGFYIFCDIQEYLYDELEQVNET